MEANFLLIILCETSDFKTFFTNDLYLLWTRERDQIHSKKVNQVYQTSGLFFSGIQFGIFRTDFLNGR
jgi:hypothetical protein